MSNQIPVVQTISQPEKPNMDHGDYVSKEEMGKAMTAPSEEKGFTKEDVDIISLKRHLDLDASEYRHDKELKYLMEWGKNKGLDKIGLYAEVKKIQMKLGYSDTKDETVKKIYQYVRLNDQMGELANKISTL